MRELCYDTSYITLLLTPSKFTFILSVQNLNILSCTCTGRCHGSGALFWTSAHRVVDQTFSMKNSVSELFALNTSMPDGKSCYLRTFYYVFLKFIVLLPQKESIIAQRRVPKGTGPSIKPETYGVVSGHAHFLLPITITLPNNSTLYRKYESTSICL